MDQTVIRETISVTATNVTEVDKALGAEFNRTMWRALAQANLYLTHGPESARLAITRSFLTAASRLSALDSQAEVEVARQSFERILTTMATEVPQHDAITETSTERTDDQDD